MIFISSPQEELNCESIVALENQVGDGESRELHGDVYRGCRPRKERKEELQHGHVW
jgi:hypothetical protein